MQLSIPVKDFYYGTSIAKMIAKSKKNEPLKQFYQYIGEDCGYFYNILPGSELIHCISQYQDIKIVESIDFGRSLLLDEKMMLCTVEESEYHDLLVHPACLQLESFKNALILGGGDCFTARTILRYPVENIDMIELDEVVVQVCAKFFEKELTGVFDDPRLKIHYQDANEFKTLTKYDYISMDLTDPDEITNLSLSLYSKPSFEKIKTYMSDKSILTLQAGCPLSMATIFQEIYTVLQETFKYVGVYGKYMTMYGGFQYFIYCSDHYDVSNPDWQLINDNIKKYGFTSFETFSPEYLRILLEEFKTFTFHKSLKCATVEKDRKIKRHAELIGRLSEDNQVIDPNNLPSLKPSSDSFN